MKLRLWRKHKSLSELEVPTITQGQLDIIRYSWERLIKIRTENFSLGQVSGASQFSCTFYQRLFGFIPHLQDSLTGAMKQTKVLVNIVSYAVLNPIIFGHNVDWDLKKIEEGVSDDSISTIRQVNQSNLKQYSTKLGHELSYQEFIEEAAKDTTPVDLSAATNEYKKLGRHHFDYKARSDQLQVFIPTLRDTLRRQLGDDYLPQVDKAWTAILVILVINMAAGIEERKAEKPSKRWWFSKKK